MLAFLRRLRFGRRFAETVATPLRLSLLRTGLHQGLFEALREPATPEALADRLGLARDLVAAWLSAAEAHGLVTSRGGRYRASGFALGVLDARNAPALVALLDQTAESYAPRLDALPELLKGAARPAFGAPDEARRAAVLARVLERRTLRRLRRVPGARRARALLDVGCGHGTLLAALLTRYRDARGVGVELDAALAEEARRTLREAQVDRRAEVHGGHFLELELPAEAFDLVLMSQSLHYFSVARRRAILERAHSHLLPGGLLVAQTPVVETGWRARWTGAAAMVASYDLFLRAHRNLAGLPDPAALDAALEEAGFEERGALRLTFDGSVRLFWGRRAP